jgi:hypothetical protein
MVKTIQETLRKESLKKSTRPTYFEQRKSRKIVNSIQAILPLCSRLKIVCCEKCKEIRQNLLKELAQWHSTINLC